MSLLINKHKAAQILGKERAIEAGQHVTGGKKQAEKTVQKAAEKLGTYSHVNVKKKKKK